MSALPNYRTPVGSWYTAVLFYEKWRTTLEPAMDPVFSLIADRPGLINARKTFVEEGDPTGYKWAMKYLGDYDHYVTLCRASWFQEALEVWQHELKMRLRSEALDKLREVASGDTSQATVAAKFIASWEWEKQSRGRPSKEELKGELKKAALVLQETDDDAQRIGLVK